MRRPSGHRQILDQLARMCDQLREDPSAPVAHAYVFCGPDGIGKFTTALWWAAQLKCDDPGGCARTGPVEPARPETVASANASTTNGGSSSREAGNGRRSRTPPPVDQAHPEIATVLGAVASAVVCPSCRQLAAGAHPDVTVVEPPEPGRHIGIAEVRELIRTIAYKPRHRGPRIAIVREAHLLTHEAQNGMLKLLEEPPGTAVIILVVENVSSLLATVRSRCQILRFGRLATDEVLEVLAAHGRTGAEAAQAASAAVGRPGRALAYDTDGLAERTRMLLAFEAVHGNPDAEIEPLVTAMAEKKGERHAWLLALLEWQIRKIEVCLGGAVDEAHPELRKALAAACRELPSRLIDEAARISDTMDALERNANAKLAVRELLLDLRG